MALWYFWNKEVYIVLTIYVVRMQKIKPLEDSLMYCLSFSSLHLFNNGFLVPT